MLVFLTGHLTLLKEVLYMPEALENVSSEYLRGEMHTLRREIDACIKMARLKQRQMLACPGIGELDLAHRKLQEAKMWVGKVLEELDSPLPEEYRDEAK
jgi:vancomycin resistance protein YoaR